MVMGIHSAACDFFPALPERGRPLPDHMAPPGVAFLSDHPKGRIRISAFHQHFEKVSRANDPGIEVTILFIDDAANESPQD